MGWASVLGSKARMKAWGWALVYCNAAPHVHLLPSPPALTRTGAVVVIWLRDEVWEGHEQACQGHKDSPTADQSGSVYSAAKIAHKHNQGCVPHLQKDEGTH